MCGIFSRFVSGLVVSIFFISTTAAGNISSVEDDLLKSERAHEFREDEMQELENTPVYNLTMDDVMLPNGMTASEFCKYLNEQYFSSKENSAPPMKECFK